MMTTSRKVRITSASRTTECALCCPTCGGDSQMHHRGVTVFDRSEDAETTTVTTIDGAVSMASMPSRESANPSSRRDGIAIQFECEVCGPMELTIAQHKGRELLEWRDSDA